MDSEASGDPLMQMRELALFAGLAGLGLALVSRPAKALVKDGVQLDGLEPEMVPAVHVANSVALELSGEPTTITSGLEGEHGEGSLHFEGLAVDVRRLDRHVDQFGGVHFIDLALAERQARAIRAALPSDFDVVLEATHVHIEFDPPHA
ncbi:MAG: hypothetical protein K5880_23035 [Hydrogenophaga sp.]|uniref:hypothetical protein n=1 Tax=Hydrogenophaga sp. TaxID=1904254 RepID=UPI002639E013|nr:hypothetical protein [Hydrogenophaga sp.]MCV0441473.1 hypothetical protein [Hydrogenophaga sp.]